MISDDKCYWCGNEANVTMNSRKLVLSEFLENDTQRIKNKRKEILQQWKIPEIEKEYGEWGNEKNNKR